jgi:hypothetical protein
MCSCILPSTSALEVVGGQRHAPAALPPGKTRYPVVLYRRLGGTPGPVWTGAKTRLPPGFDPRTVQPLASHYTDRAIPAHFLSVGRIEISFVVNVQRSSCRVSIILVRF